MWTRGKNCIEVSIFATNRKKVLACSCQWQQGRGNARSKLEPHVEDGEGVGATQPLRAHGYYMGGRRKQRKLEPHGRDYPLLTWH